MSAGNGSTSCSSVFIKGGTVSTTPEALSVFEDFFFPHFIHHSVLPGVGAGGSPLLFLVTWTLVSAGDVFAFLRERYSFLRINSRMRCIFLLFVHDTECPCFPPHLSGTLGSGRAGSIVNE